MHSLVVLRAHPADQEADARSGLALQVYWSLPVMTKGPDNSAHESRECLYAKEDVVTPLAERAYTIFVWCVGAVVFALIFGDVASVVEAANAAGERWRRRMDTLREFMRFHSVGDALQTKLVNVVEKNFAQTRGIDIDDIAGRLPTHLQLECFYQINIDLVRSAAPFRR